MNSPFVVGRGCSRAVPMDTATAGLASTLAPSGSWATRLAVRPRGLPTTRRRLGRLACAVALAAIGAGFARAQTAGAEDPEQVAGRAAASLEDPLAGTTWSFSASAFAYFVPEDRNYVQPTVTADRGTLHLEARYNYEAQETGSAWLGVNFGDEGTLRWEFTPMLGGVFGDTTGIAPGVRGLVGWRALELSVEGEYVMDMGDAAGSFLYLWSELTVSPLEWFRVGVASQRTRAYRSELDVQRGFTIGFTYRALDLAAYVFNPDEDEPTVVVAVSFDLE